MSRHVTPISPILHPNTILQTFLDCDILYPVKEGSGEHQLRAGAYLYALLQTDDRLTERTVDSCEED